MTIKYCTSDLKDNSTRVLKEYSTMSDALNNLNTLINNVSEHWTGNDKAAFIALLSEKINTLTKYLNELQTIATNLNTAADYYEKHEEYFSASLW